MNQVCQVAPNGYYTNYVPVNYPNNPQQNIYPNNLNNCQYLCAAKIDPEVVRNGVEETTKLLQSLTALLAAGVGLKEAIRILLPQTTPQEAEQFANTLKACKSLDIEA